LKRKVKDITQAFQKFSVSPARSFFDLVGVYQYLEGLFRILLFNSYLCL